MSHQPGRPRTRFAALVATVALIAPTVAALAISTPAHAAGSVKLTVAGKPIAGQQTKLAARVKPTAKGRTVVFSVKAGKKWKKLGAATTNKQGTAVISTKTLTAGKQTVRAVAKKHKGQKAKTDKTKVQVSAAPRTSGKASTLAAPSHVVVGADFEFTVDVAAVTGGVLTITAPTKGAQVRRAGDVEVRDGTARVDLGTVPAGTPRTVTVRWRAPASPTQLQIRADLNGAGVSDRLSTTVEVVKDAADGVPSLGHDVHLFGMAGSLPQDGDDLVVMCTTGQSQPIPSYADAMKQIDAWVDGQFISGTKSLWKNSPDLKTSAGAHKVFAQAYLDDRLAAMMAAAIVGHRLAPKDARHLSNAAMAANLLGRFGWAVALAQKAAGLPPASSGGVAQDAVRLNNLGHAWAQMGNFAKAEASLREAIRQQPANPLLHRELGAILSCAGRSDDALTEMREGNRDSTEPDEVVVRDDYTQVDPERAFDMSEAVAGDLALFDVPATMERLIGLDGRDGAVGADEDALYEQFSLLIARRLQLDKQLRDREPLLHPAEVRRSRSVLRRMNQTASKDVLALYNELNDALGEVAYICSRAQFGNHPWCNIDQPPTTCAQHRQFADAYTQRLSAFRQALVAYHEVAWPTWTGLQGNLSDPIAHELAGVLMELEINTWAGGLSNHLRHASEQFAGFNYSAEGLPSGTTCTNPEPLPPNATTETKIAGDKPPLCSDRMKPWALEASVLIATMKVSCEKVSFEISTPVPALAAFAKVELDFNAQGWHKSSRLVIGVKGGAPLPGSSYMGEAAVYLEQDRLGKLTDVGFTAGTELEIGHTIKLTADEAKSKWSFMNASSTY